MNFDQELLRLIDARILAARENITRFGTVRSRDPGYEGPTDQWPDQYTAMVQFDGDAGSVPVLCPANVRARPGDRVLLHKVAAPPQPDEHRRRGEQWVIGSSFGSPGAGSFPNFPVWGWPQTTHTSDDSLGTTGVYDPMGFHSTYFAKETDWAWVDVDWRGSMYVTVQPTLVRIGARFANRADGTVTVWDLKDFHFNLAVARLDLSARTTRVFVSPGEYDVSMVWKKISGTGTLTIKSDDDGDALLLQETVTPYYERG